MVAVSGQSVAPGILVINVIVESVLFGAYTLLMLLLIFYVGQKALRSKPQFFLTVACAIMYVSAATHWAMFIPWRGLSSVGLSAFDLLSGSNQVGGCAFTLMLLINVILSDVIVLWRVWVLWAQHRFIRMIQICSVLLIIATTLMSSLNARDTCHNPAFHAEFADVFGVTALSLSWVTNVFATILVIIKAWRHRRLLKMGLQSGSTRTKAEKALLLFVDSGIIYSTLWTLILIGFIVDRGRSLLTLSAPLAEEQFMVGFFLLMDTGLIDLIGIYPTVLVILSALTTYSEPLLQPNDLRLIVTDTSFQNRSRQQSKLNDSYPSDRHSVASELHENVLDIQSGSMVST